MEGEGLQTSEAGAFCESVCNLNERIRSVLGGTGTFSGPDPGFPVGGHGPFFGGFWPPMRALFSKNVCESKRIGSCRGAYAGTPPRSANDFVCRSATGKRAQVNFSDEVFSHLFVNNQNCFCHEVVFFSSVQCQTVVNKNVTQVVIFTTAPKCFAIVFGLKPKSFTANRD